MSNQAIASYLPDLQLIKLGADLPAFADPENPRGIEGPHELAYFFHEWVHFFHNVSTIHGLSAFANLVHLWGHFRSSIGEDGLSRGSASLSDQENLWLHQKFAFSNAERARRPNPLPPGAKVELVTVTGVNFRDASLPGLPLTTRVIVCDLEIHNDQGDHFPAKVEIGSHEIVESVAYMLEDRLTRKCGATPRPLEFAPYYLLRVLAQHVAPTLSDECVAACGLAALQDSDPPSTLLDVLRRAELEKTKGNDPLQFIANTQSRLLHDARKWIDERLEEIETRFPNDEPMARAVRKTLATIRWNFEFRRHSPLVEFSLIDLIASDCNTLTQILAVFGGCAVLQQRPGYDDDVERDVLVEFVLDTDDNQELYEGRRIMHAAFRFVALHAGRDGSLLATSEIAETRSNMCPYYTTCTIETRKENPTVCAEKPWQTITQGNLCWYGRAVHIIASPEIAARRPVFNTPLQA